MTPGAINAQCGKVVYRCRVCRTDQGLSWFGGTSCPVCPNPACQAACAAEYQKALDDALRDES